MKKTLSILLLYCCFFGAYSQTEKLETVVSQPAKYAIVIGVNNYKSQSLRPLQSPLNDAEDMKNALVDWGYNVKIVKDGDLKTMNDSLIAFIRQIPRNAIVVFYFSGHGIGYNGRNYLLLKDSNIQCFEDLEFQGFPLERVLQDIDKRQPITKLAFIDACRNISNINSCIETTKNTYNGGPVRPANLTRGTFIAFATQEGKTAFEMYSDRNSLFTNELLKYIKKPDLSLRTIIDYTTTAVEKRSEKKQIPNRYDELRGDFWFSGKMPVTPISAPLNNPTTTTSKEVNDNPCSNDPSKKCGNTKEHFMTTQYGYGKTKSAALKDAEKNVQISLAGIFGIDVNSQWVGYESHTSKDSVAYIRKENIINDTLTSNYKIFGYENYCISYTSEIVNNNEIFTCSLCGKIPIELNIERYEQYLEQKGFKRKVIKKMMNDLRKSNNLSKLDVGGLAFIPTAAQFKRSEPLKALGLLTFESIAIGSGAYFANQAAYYRSQLSLYSTSPVYYRQFQQKIRSAQTASILSFAGGTGLFYLISTLDGISKNTRRNKKNEAYSSRNSLTVNPYYTSAHAGFTLSIALK